MNTYRLSFEFDGDDVPLDLLDLANENINTISKKVATVMILEADDDAKIFKLADSLFDELKQQSSSCYVVAEVGYMTNDEFHPSAEIYAANMGP